MDQAQQLRNIIKKQQVRELGQANNARKAMSITITSGKGGVGKSSTAVNLAISLSELGKKVIILDADFGLANIEVMFGIRPKYSLADVIFRGMEIDSIITPGPSNIGFISAGSGIQELANLSRDQIRNISERLWKLDQLADYIIIDTGAGISDSVLQFIYASDITLIITTPEPTSITDAYAMLKAVNNMSSEQASRHNIRMLANRVESYNEGEILFAKLNTVVSKFLLVKPQYIGCVFQDKLISRSVMDQKPVKLLAPNSNSSKQYDEIAAIIDSRFTKEQNTRKGILSLFTNTLFGNRNS